MNRAFISTATILGWLSIFNIALCQEVESYQSKIDSLLISSYPRRFNGVVLIHKNGKSIYSRSVGLADFSKNIKLNFNYRFSTMSIAKQITAALVLKEVEKGTIGLDRPVGFYLPYLPYEWANTVTVHQLLNHTSGLSNEQIDMPLKLDPGSGFSYSNVAYALLGQIVETVTSQGLPELVVKLFQSCGLKDNPYPKMTGTDRLAKGHILKRNGSLETNDRTNFKPSQYWASHLIVSATDLARWNECLHNGKLLDPNTYKLMVAYSIKASHEVFGDQPVGYGYGLRINDTGRILEIGHTGYHPVEGYTVVNLYYPQSKVSVIVLENQGAEDYNIAYFFEKEIRAIVMNSCLLNY
ncbi:serine hydrolase domain-containing protein [Larkinella soli]|uniref:serine hydrolase domain-containing protein n=1 Tax=Larkinella soli TaxID=1770527 RepID=UPI000FFC1E2C|nr:serine hydrolase domain-containing protein [Larkinella soli]